MAKGEFFDNGAATTRIKFSDNFIWLSSGINPVHIVASTFIALAALLY
jgi:hypothetical protein